MIHILHIPKVNTYRRRKDGPEHEFLFSLPLLDPPWSFPLAVLNAGTSSLPHADLMRTLKIEELSDLAGTMHRQPLSRLLKAAGLNPGYNETEEEPWPSALRKSSRLDPGSKRIGSC